jgi:two-component system sensor kinase
MQARIECNLGELVFKCGDMRAAIEAYEGALRKLGNRVPRWSLGFSLLLCREMLVQTLHTLFPRLFLGRTTPTEADKQLLTVRLHNRLCYAYWFGKSKTSCLWTHLRGMNLAERYPPTRELAQAYSIHAPVMSLVPYVGRGVAYAQKSWAIYLSVGDVWGQGQALHFHGIVLYVAARYEEAIEKLRESVRLLKRIGDYWEVNVARYHTALCHYRLGDLGTAASLAKEVHLSGLELGDIQAAGVSLDIWVLASGGKVSPTTLQAELERPRADVQVTAQLMLAEGARLFMAGRFEEAAALFEAGHRRAVDTGIHNAYVLPLRSWLAAALRQQALAEPGTNTGRRSLLLKRASRVARKAVRVARAFQTDLPHALREAALIAAIRGSTRRARRDLDESLAVAQRQGARFEHAQTLQARGRLGLAAGWPNAQADLDAAHAALHALGADFAIER